MADAFSTHVSTREADEAPGNCAAEEGADLEECRVQLQRFLSRRLRREQDVKDLVQEVYVRFLQTPRRAVVRHPLAYLYRIAANLLHDMRLRERQGRVTFNSELAEQEAESRMDSWTSDTSDRLSAQREVQSVLQQLPALYQAVLLLRKRDGLSCSEIAQQLGISKFTVEKYLYRAIVHFKEADWDR